MQQKRILIILVVVLVVIFIVGVVRGPTQGGNNKVSIDSIQNGFVGTLRNLMVKPQHLTVQDIQGQAGCFSSSNLFVAQGSTCNYTIIERRGVPVRNVKLDFSGVIPGRHATLTLVPQGALTGTLEIPNSTPNRNLDVYEKGGLLKVACDGTANCLLTFN